MTHVCPWPPCGQELEDDHRHVGHEVWAKDPDHDYVRVPRPDGVVDVFRVPSARSRPPAGGGEGPGGTV